MPKMKTHKGASKRLKQTASGRLKRHKANHSHILTKKGPKRKRRLREGDLVDKSDHHRTMRMLPYGLK
jgi:large subunit ribosomal protein L35